MADVRMAFSADVQRARRAGWPIVALESAFLSHGLPWPINLETSRAMEAAVRAAGATPATIAIIEGQIRVGLETQHLERLARGEGISKASQRDLAWQVVRRHTAGTTVSSTLFVAHRAGIGLLATGGIGGVHRGFETQWDVSADLIELARNPVAVVCSGAKAILDLPRTLEWLETLGVPVLGYRSNELPSFLGRSSGLHLEQRVDSPAEAAAVIRAARQLGITSSIVFAIPPPSEHAIPKQELERMIEQATREASVANVHGKHLTPYLLERLRELSGGAALEVNRSLLVRNAELAAQIAVALET